MGGGNPKQILSSEMKVEISNEIERWELDPRLYSKVVVKAEDAIQRIFREFNAINGILVLVDEIVLPPWQGERNLVEMETFYKNRSEVGNKMTEHAETLWIQQKAGGAFPVKLFTAKKDTKHYLNHVLDSFGKPWEELVIPQNRIEQMFADESPEAHLLRSRAGFGLFVPVLGTDGKVHLANLWSVREPKDRKSLLAQLHTHNDILNKVDVFGDDSLLVVPA
jgi:hypothetical protein